MRPNDESANVAFESSNRGGADVGGPREREMQSDREGDASRVANVEERTTAAHAAAPSSGDTSIGEGEGGGGRGTAPSVSTTAATSATLTVAKGGHQDQRQRDEYGHEDDVVTATWSLDSDGRPVSMPHSWHPSVHEGGGGGGGNYARGGGGVGVGAGAAMMMPGGVPPPGGGLPHSRRGAHASSSHHNFRSVRSSAGDQFRQQYPAAAAGGGMPTVPSQYHPGYHRQDQHQQYSPEDYRYHGGHRPAPSIPPQPRHHAPPTQEHGGYSSHVGAGVGRAPQPQFVDRRPSHDPQQQQQLHRDYHTDHPAGGVGVSRGGGGGGGHYYPQEEQQQPYHARRADHFRHSPTRSAYPPSNPSIHPPPMPHRPPAHPAATASSSSSQLQMMQMQHHPPYHPQLLSMNVGTVVGAPDHNPLLSTRQRHPAQKGCSCRKTRCLKLYCQCFAASVLCSPNQCICDKCQNNEAEAMRGNRGAIAIARRQVLVRNPNAFDNKFLENNAAVGGVGGGGVVAGAGSSAAAVASDAAAAASMAVIYRPPPLRHNGSVDSGRQTGYARVGYGGFGGGNDVHRGAVHVPAQQQQQQQLARPPSPPPPPPTESLRHEYRFRPLDCPSTSTHRQEDAVVDEAVEEVEAALGCEDKEVGKPSEGGSEGDDVGAAPAPVDASTSIEFTKADEDKDGDAEQGEEKVSFRKDDTSKSSEGASSGIKQEVDNVGVDDPRDDRPEKEAQIDLQTINAEVVIVQSEREVDEEEREPPENDNILEGSSSSISTSKSLEPSSTSSFSKPSFESNNAWYRQGHENAHSRSWEVDRRQRGGSYNSDYEGRHAATDHYYNQHHPSMRGLGYNQESHRGFDHPSLRGNSTGGGMPGGTANNLSSGMRPYPAVAHQYPGGGPLAHHVVQSHQLPAARLNMGGERGHANLDMQQMQSIPSKVHRVGCKCKKSKCLKKYCECFSNGIKCASHCKCENCGNQPEGDRPSNPQGSTSQTSIVNTVAPSSDQSIEMSPGQTLHMVSSEEDKLSITQHPPSVPSLDATLDGEQYSNEGSSNHQDIMVTTLTATAMPSGTSDDENMLDFLATLASSALDTLNADANNAAKKRQASGEEDQLFMDGKEFEGMDQQETTLKRRRLSDDMASRDKYVAGQQEHQYHHDQQHYQYQASQGYHYDQYVRHHPQYEEHGGHPAYQHQGSHHQQQQHRWTGVQYQVDSRSFAPGGQQGHPHGAPPHPQAIRPQFSRCQPSQNHNSSAQYPTIPSAMTAVHVPENIASALAAAHLKNKLPKGLTYRKVCSHCGRQRAEHGEFGFGNKCPFTTCGRCGADEDLHRKDNGTCCMGVYCTLTEEVGAKRGASDKYDVMLADLAARAEVRAGMTIALERC